MRWETINRGNWEECKIRFCLLDYHDKALFRSLMIYLKNKGLLVDIVEDGDIATLYFTQPRSISFTLLPQPAVNKNNRIKTL